jgi:hypothetical protein
MNAIYCLCNHSAAAHYLTVEQATAVKARWAECSLCDCEVFEEDPTYQPEESDEATPGGPVPPGAGSEGR